MRFLRQKIDYHAFSSETDEQKDREEKYILKLVDTRIAYIWKHTFENTQWEKAEEEGGKNMLKPVNTTSTGRV